MTEAAPEALFRFDAGPGVGNGHAIRSTTLAHAMAEAGWHCSVATTQAALDAVPQIERIGPVHKLVSNSQVKPEEELHHIDGAELLVIDHYSRGRDYETSQREKFPRLVVFEDLPTRAHDCDVLIDPTPGRDRGSYETLVPAACTLCLGPKFAVLRPQFREYRAQALARRREAQVERVLIAVGADDADNLTSQALAAVVENFPNFWVDIVLGPTAAHLEAIRNLVRQAGSRVNLSVNVENMAELMTKADIAIGAAGSSALERCALALPSVAIVAADNQRDIAYALEEHGAALSVKAHAQSGAIGSALKKLVVDTDGRREMGRAASALCDARGEKRVMLRMVSPVSANDQRPVTLRLAEQSDENCLLEWQSHPATRRYSRQPEVPSAEGHREWLNRRLQDDDCLLTIIEHGGEEAGMLRLDRKSEGTEISILTDPQRQRTGIARAALALARRAVPGDNLVAEVLAGNTASHALFVRAGFKEGPDGLYHMPRLH